MKHEHEDEVIEEVTIGNIIYEVYQCADPRCRKVRKKWLKPSPLSDTE